MLTLLFGQLCRRLFFGRLRDAEVDSLYDRSWYAITETCLAMTIFREDLEPPEQNYCFKKEADRDKFLTACQNLAEGRDWSVNGTSTRASARKAMRAAAAAG